jgi:hypothetical protein
MREHQPFNTVPPSRRGGVECGGVAADAVSEVDRPLPASRVGEHEIHAGGPARELEELGHPGDLASGDLDEITEGRVGCVDDGQRRHGEAVEVQWAYRWLETQMLGTAADVRHEFGAGVGHEPSGEWRPGCRTAAIDHHPPAAPPDE